MCVCVCVCVFVCVSARAFSFDLPNRVLEPEWFDIVVGSVGLDVDLQAMPLGLNTVSALH